MQKKIDFLKSDLSYNPLKKGNPIFSMKLGHRLPKSLSQLHVKNSRFYLS